MKPLESVISAVENRLQPVFHLKGCPPDVMSLKERMAYHNVPGFSIALIENGELAWASPVWVTME